MNYLLHIDSSIRFMHVIDLFSEHLKFQMLFILKSYQFRRTPSIEVLPLPILFNWIFFTVMRTSLFVWVLFVLTHIGLSEPGSKLKHGYSQIVYGHRIKDKTISSFAPISFLDCVEECLIRNRCLSVSYFKGANYCEIKYEDKLTAASSYQEQAGWVYSEKRHWPTVNITCTLFCSFGEFLSRSRIFHLYVTYARHS